MMAPKNPLLFHKDDHPNKLHNRRFLEKPAVLKEYQCLGVISRGTFGVVYRACHKITNEIVAVKEAVHESMTPSTRTEINILQSLPRHPSVVYLKEVKTEGDRVFMVMEYIKYDLDTLRAAKGKPFSLIEIRFLIEKILQGVKFLHDNRVMHRDLKPANILVRDNDSKVKICDFGLSTRSKTAWGRGVGTRFYKAPEVLVGYSNTKSAMMHTRAVDMWAVGCIMAELVLDQPLFQGRSDADQLDCIRSILLSPYNRLRLKMATAASYSGATTLTPSGYDLLERLLTYDPSKRISARDALDHAWFKQVLYLTPPYN